MKTALLVGLILIITAGLVMAGCSRGGHRFGHGNPDKIVDRITKKLGLDNGQKQQLTAIKNDIVSKKDQLRPDRSAIMGEIESQFKNDVVDEARLRAVIDTEKAKLDEIANLAVAKISEFHKILTPEQRAMVVEKMSKWKERGKWGKRCDYGKKS